MPVSLVSLSDGTSTSTFERIIDCESGGTFLPEPMNTQESAHYLDAISVSNASMSGDLSSQSSEYYKPHSPINRSQLHYGFENRQMHFKRRRPGTNIMREIEYPTSIFEYNQEYDTILRQCFEDEEEVMVLVFEDSKRELLCLASFLRQFLELDAQSAELLFFDRKGRVSKKAPEEVTLHFVDFLRCSRSIIDTEDRRGIKRLKRLVKRDVQSCIIHDKMNRKRQRKQLRNSIAPKRFSNLPFDLQEGEPKEQIAWLSGSEFRSMFGFSLQTVKEVLKEGKK
jgi:hypothetical protein